MCAREGKRTVALVVDHRIPHRGDRGLFWMPSNWQSLCKPHHDSVKQAEEKGGVVKGHGLDGLPISSTHPWLKSSQIEPGK